MSGSRGNAPGGTFDHQEVEWQFDAVDLRPVQRWLSSRGADAVPSVGPGPVREHVDTYWDTDDWRLYRAGWSLRTRDTGDGRASCRERVYSGV